MCDKAGLPQPYNILMECVQRLARWFIIVQLLIFNQKVYEIINIMPSFLS